MAVGWGVNGVCYESTAAALKGFQQGFVHYEGTSISSLVSSSITSAGVISYSISSRDLVTSSSVVSRTGTFALNTCDYSYVQTKDLPDMVLAGLLFFAVFLGFLSGYRP